MSGFRTIPGETPIGDLSHLRDKTIRTRGRLNVAEAENIRKAIVKYLAARPTKRQAPFNHSWCLRLHRQMFGDVWLWAGTLRTEDLNIGVPWQQVETRLYSLMEDLPCWGESGLPLIEQATRLHHLAVQIHPFLNGNGRWSRLLANIWLKQNRQPITDWPEQNLGLNSPIRQEYLQAVRAADDGDYDPLLQLHRRFAQGA
jgi:Fic-DOC domain mobile mystery protein B